MSTRIHILGSGTPTPTADRFGSAFAVEVDGRLSLVDCGPATTWKLAKVGLPITAISDLFFTHHHFDHNVDYPCFVLTRWDQSAESNPLRVYGPPPTERITHQLFGPEGAFAPDYTARVEWESSQKVYINRGGELPRIPPQIEAHDIGDGFTIENDFWRITTAVPLHAQPYLESLAYRIETAEGSIVFTGDTEPCDAVRELAAGADVLFCMAWEIAERVRETGETIGTCDVTDAARMASDSGVSKLVLVHSGPGVSAPENIGAAVEEARRSFGGEIVFAEELTQISL